jgi:acyl-CoA thioester hydrolase
MRLTVQPALEIGQYEFRHRLRVRFAETDAMGVVHHGAYLPYLEEARVEYLRSIGRPYTVQRADGLEFPVVEVWIGYRAPLRFDDEVDVGLEVADVSRATFQVAYCLSTDGSTKATAVTLHGCVDSQGRARRLPSWARTELVSPAADAAAGDALKPRLLSAELSQ